MQGLADFWRARWRVLTILLAALAIEWATPFTPPSQAQVYPEARQAREQQARRAEIRRRVINRRRAIALRAAIAERRARNPELFERNRGGAAVLRGRIIAIDPSPRGIAVMRRLGMRVLRDRTVGELGVRVMVLRAPQRLSAVAALEILQAADPQGAYELNHVFNPTGQSGQSKSSPAGASGAPTTGGTANGAGLKIGMIDGGVDTSHPALVRTRLTTRSFTPTPAPSAHGTAVASLLVGADEDFRGAAPGAELFAADVFGDDTEGGSAEAIADAIGWLASQRVHAINISLEGPPNKLIEIVCRAAQARGIILVAAVGNSGPSTPVAYPAAYPSVIAVTAVDTADRVYLMANRGPQIAFASLGVDIEAATEGDEYESVSGTSFASPRIAAALALERAGSPQAAVAELAAHAQDLGAPGRDAIYGFGRAP